ncbi:MAG: Hsp20/alpha crystallin family protein [Deltaproteobacteria bacterium]|nr:Hsp20/alpha crystallin family protein [Deltaproteobacteria bacterium]
MNATIDETIERVEQLYTVLTGKPPARLNGHRVMIPPEVDPAVHVQERLDRLVHEMEQLAPVAAAAPPMWIPRAVAWTQEGALVFALDVPGVVARDVQIRVEPLALVVRGIRRAPWPHPPHDLAACDAPMGAFARSFPVARVAPDQIGARLEDGVLTIRVHRGARAEPSQIPIVS